MQTHYSWMTRLYVSCSVAVTASIAILDPGSQHRAAFEGNASFLTFAAIVGMVFLLLIAVAGIADVVINDFLPERYTIGCTHKHRHVVFMLMAGGQVALMWMVSRAGEPGDFPPVLARYALDAAAAVAVAVWGVRDHYFRRVCR